jgi:hypothetical protein
MTLAETLLKLWSLRIGVGIGILVAIAAAAASMTTSHSTVYASASTEMLVDSPQSALANADVDLSGYLTRANVFARLMTSSQAIQAIGKAAGIPGQEIEAEGPVEVNGAQPATHAPAATVGGQNVPITPVYKLQFVQNPNVPTIDVFAQAPTTEQAVALANAAVSGFGTFMNQLNAGNAVPTGKRITVRQLGGATGGMVDAAASKKIAALVFVAVLFLWCGLVLWFGRFRRQLREAKTKERGGQGPGEAQPALAEDLPPKREPDIALTYPGDIDGRRDELESQGGDRRDGFGSQVGGRRDEFEDEVDDCTTPSASAADRGDQPDVHGLLRVRS